MGEKTIHFSIRNVSWRSKMHENAAMRAKNAATDQPCSVLTLDLVFKAITFGLGLDLEAHDLVLDVAARGLGLGS